MMSLSDRAPASTGPGAVSRRLAASVAVCLMLSGAGVVAAAAQDTARRGAIVTITLHSRALEGNTIGDTADREVTIYLPPGYEADSTRRYPVLYLLHGMTSRPVEWLDGTYQGLDLGRAMDAVAERAGGAYIVVMPMADNRFGGTFYVNSRAFGGWEDFVARELPAEIDRRYRTRGDRASRGLAGQSMGAFGALSLAGRHPDVFGFVYASSPCCLGFVGELAPGSRVWTTLAQPDDAAGGRRRSSEEQRVRALALALGSDVAHRDRWRDLLPLERVRANPAPYARLCGLAIDFGVDDAITSVPAGSRAFAMALTAAGIRHEVDAFAGGHVDRLRERFEAHLLPYFARVFSGGVPCRD